MCNPSCGMIGAREEGKRRVKTLEEEENPIVGRGGGITERVINR